MEAGPGDFRLKQFAPAELLVVDPWEGTEVKGTHPCMVGAIRPFGSRRLQKGSERRFDLLSTGGWIPGKIIKGEVPNPKVGESFPHFIGQQSGQFPLVAQVFLPGKRLEGVPMSKSHDATAQLLATLAVLLEPVEESNLLEEVEVSNGPLKGSFFGKSSLVVEPAQVANVLISQEREARRRGQLCLQRRGEVFRVDTRDLMTGHAVFLEHGVKEMGEEAFLRIAKDRVEPILVIEDFVGSWRKGKMASDEGNSPIHHPKEKMLAELADPLFVGMGLAGMG